MKNDSSQKLPRDSNKSSKSKKICPQDLLMLANANHGSDIHRFSEPKHPASANVSPMASQSRNMNKSMMKEFNGPKSSFKLNNEGNQDSSIMHFEAQMKINESQIPNRESLRPPGDQDRILDDLYNPNPNRPSISIDGKPHQMNMKSQGQRLSTNSNQQNKN